MKKIIKIGVSGDRGSFSEMAGQSYIKKRKIKANLAYLIDMERVLRALDNRKINFGIFPVANSLGGLVREAFEAMGKHNFKLIDELQLKVEHYLLVLPKNKQSKINKIYSYSQAFIQCQNYLKKHFPKARQVYWHDTAKAARDLKNGKFGPNAAVIAPKTAAKIYGLQIYRSKIQDSKDNLTTFIIVKRNSESE